MEGEIQNKTRVRYRYKERDWLAISLATFGIILSITNLWLYYNLQKENNSISGNVAKTASQDFLFNEVLAQLTYKSNILKNQNMLCNDTNDTELKINNNLFRNASNYFSKRNYSSSLDYLNDIKIEINCSKSIESIFCYEKSEFTGMATSEIGKSRYSIKIGFLFCIIIIIIITLLVFKLIMEKGHNAK